VTLDREELDPINQRPAGSSTGVSSLRRERRVHPSVVSERVPANGADRLLIADELAERWQVPKAQVYRLTREGRIPAVRLGRYYRYARGSIASFEAAGGVAADG
jgi:excisionase family DNA binding protein